MQLMSLGERQTLGYMRFGFGEAAVIFTTGVAVERVYGHQLACSFVRRESRRSDVRLPHLNVQ